MLYLGDLGDLGVKAALAYSRGVVRLARLLCVATLRRAVECVRGLLGIVALGAFSWDTAVA